MKYQEKQATTVPKKFAVLKVAPFDGDQTAQKYNFPF